MFRPTVHRVPSDGTGFCFWREAAQAPPAYMGPTPEEWKSQMHEMAERRANSFRFSPQVQREMSRACGDADLADLVRTSHRPQGPSAQGVVPSSQTLMVTRGGGGTHNESIPGNSLGPPLFPVDGHAANFPSGVSADSHSLGGQQVVDIGPDLRWIRIPFA
jgi:hypothetical protein